MDVQIFPAPARPTPLPLGLSMPGGRSLDRFLGKLAALKNGLTRRVRISVWGASHVAGEGFTGQLRRRLQAVFGDGGPGFVLLGRPWRSYRHSSVKFGESKNWRSERLWSRYSRRRPAPRDDLFGIAGISVHAPRPAYAWLIPRRRRPVTALDLYFLRQPQGGKLVVLAEEKPLRWLFTVASKKEPAFARIELPPGATKVDFTTQLGEVRIFGVDLESGKPGVVLDAFGINGARSGSVLKWNEELMAIQLQRLAPDLIVMAYGSNSIDNKSLTPAVLARSFDRYLNRMRRATPDADCLVVSPADQARRIRGQGWQIPANLDWIIATMRKASLRRGCAFWDWREVMGGSGSVFRWATSAPTLVKKDHLHFTFKGYTAFGDALHGTVMALWNRYRAAARKQATP